jgi:glycosyl transferase family 87
MCIGRPARWLVCMTQVLTTPAPATRAGSSARFEAFRPLRSDVVLYAGCSVAAAGLAAFTGLAIHRTWGQLAMVGYAAAALVAFGQLLAVRRGTVWPGAMVARTALAGVTWVATAVVPMLLLAAAGWAQAEVRVVERAGARWLATGSPYLSREAIAALPAGDRLDAYTPYQPGMALFGVPRALDPAAGWWSDARIWFAAVTVAALASAMVVIGRTSPGARLRAWQVAAVVPTAALATAVGGDDLPVLALCLLGLALAARERPGAAGLAVGAAAALKLIAWPVAVVLAVYAATRGRGALVLCGAGLLGLPLLTLLPGLWHDPGAVLENTVRFPLGTGLVVSPADSPLLGHLIASRLPDGGTLAAGLLAAAGVAIAAWLLHRPPRTAAAVAAISGSGLLAAIVLMPASRWGYLLYPLALLAWVPALRDRHPAWPGSRVIGRITG